MDKDEILEKSRKENNNKDLAELEVRIQAGNAAWFAGVFVCLLLSGILWIMGKPSYSPWIIYYSMFGTTCFVRFVKIKRKSDLFLSCLFYLASIMGLVFFVIRLVGEAS